MSIRFALLFHKKIQQLFKDGLGIPSDPAHYPAAWNKAQFKTYTRAPKISLSVPSKPLPTLDTVLKERHSTRTFITQSITIDDLATLLYYAGGINRSRSSDNPETSVRHYPSGGALFPVEIYLYIKSVDSLEEGVYHYNVKDHTLEHIAHGTYAHLADRAIYPWANTAPVTLFLTAVWERNFQKYKDYGYPIVLLETGHLAQNIQLVAQALQMEYCSYVGFDSDILEELLDIHREGKESVLYVTSLGAAKK